MQLFGFWEIKLRNSPFSWYFLNLYQVSICRVHQYMQSNKILRIHKRVMLEPLEILTASFLYSTDIHPVAQDRSSIHSINLVYRNTDEECFNYNWTHTVFCGRIHNNHSCTAKGLVKTHTRTLQQRPIGGNYCSYTLSNSLGRCTDKNMTVAKNTAWLKLVDHGYVPLKGRLSTSWESDAPIHTLTLCTHAPLAEAGMTGNCLIRAAQRALCPVSSRSVSRHCC